LTEGGGRALFIEPNFADRGQPEGAEQAVIGLYDYARDRSLVALVDPKRGEVVSVEQTPGQFQLSKSGRTRSGSPMPTTGSGSSSVDAP
jgi:hypothetical protein